MYVCLCRYMYTHTHEYVHCSQVRELNYKLCFLASAVHLADKDGWANFRDEEVDAEIADLQRQLDEAKRKKKRKKGSPTKRKPLHPQFVEDNLVGLDGKTCPSCVN